MRPRSPPQAARRPPAIASLQDALAYPEQPAQLGPLKSSPQQQQKKKSRAKKKASASQPQPPRKQFPRALARFRDRLQYLEERLRLDVNALRQEVRDLELRRSLLEQRSLSTRLSVTGSAAQLVREYFGVFACGFQRFPDGDDVDVRAMRMLHELNIEGGSKGGDAAQKLLSPQLRALQAQIETASRQQRFLEAVVDPQLVFQRFIGRDVLVDQWQRYSQYHAGLCMHMNTLEVLAVSEARQQNQRRQSSMNGAKDDEDDDDDSSSAVAVLTTGRLTAHMTQDTLEQIFPHVLRNPSLAQRLIGAFIEYPFRLELHVNGDGRITTYDADVDFVSALSGVLGNLEDVTLLMRDALITEYCMIGHLDTEEAEEMLETRCEIVEIEGEDEMEVDETREPSRVSPDQAGGDRDTIEDADMQRDAAAEVDGVSKAAIRYILS